MIVKTIIIKENKDKTFTIDVTERSLQTQTKNEVKIVKQIDTFLKNELEV